MGLLAQGQRFLNGVMKAEGQSITYTRERVSLSGIYATVDNPVDAIGQNQSYFVESDQIDFALDIADLGSLVMPAAGDQIDWTSGERTYHCIVFPTKSESCFNWLDGRRCRVSVHAKVHGIN